MEAIGRQRWAIAEGYIPSESSFSDRALISHETACILNAGERDARVAITIFFANREPVDPARHRLCLGIRIRRPDHRAAHAARFAPRRSRAFVDGCLRGRLRRT
jgi:hypothetical protein